MKKIVKLFLIFVLSVIFCPLSYASSVNNYDDVLKFIKENPELAMSLIQEIEKANSSKNVSPNNNDEFVVLCKDSFGDDIKIGKWATKFIKTYDDYCKVSADDMDAMNVMSTDADEFEVNIKLAKELYNKGINCDKDQCDFIGYVSNASLRFSIMLAMFEYAVGPESNRNSLQMKIYDGLYSQLYIYKLMLNEMENTEVYKNPRTYYDSRKTPEDYKDFDEEWLPNGFSKSSDWQDIEVKPFDYNSLGLVNSQDNWDNNLEE